MTVIIHLALTEDLAKLGKVAHVVKIGHFHGMDDRFYVETYKAKYWVLPGACASASKPQGHEVPLFTTDVSVMTTDSLPPLPGLEIYSFEHVYRPEAGKIAHQNYFQFNVMWIVFFFFFNFKQCCFGTASASLATLC